MSSATCTRASRRSARVSGMIPRIGIDKSWAVRHDTRIAQTVTSQHLARPVCVGTALVLLVLAAWSLVTTAITQPYFLASDIVEGYLPGAQRFLDSGSPYTADQLAGPWSIGFHTFIHPPSALPLFAPFLVLPLPLWWAIPLGLTGYAVWRLRPAPWTWPLMVLCLCWPRSTGALLTGNSDIWAMAAVAAGAMWGWPVALLAIKPTFAPLALVGARHRSTWIAAAVWLAFVAVTLPLWIQWWTAIGNAGLGWGYSVWNLPLVLLPVVAWLGRQASYSTDQNTRQQTTTPTSTAIAVSRQIGSVSAIVVRTVDTIRR